MLLRWLYYGISIVLSVPFVAFHAIVSIVMWDAKYWDNACHGIYETLSDNKGGFLNKPTTFVIIAAFIALSMSSCATNGYGCRGTGKLITRVPQ
jgi:hypothetical protein